MRPVVRQLCIGDLALFLALRAEPRRRRDLGRSATAGMPRRSTSLGTRQGSGTSSGRSFSCRARASRCPEARRKCCAPGSIAFGVLSVLGVCPALQRLAEAAGDSRLTRAIFTRRSFSAIICRWRAFSSSRSSPRWIFSPEIDARRWLPRWALVVIALLGSITLFVHLFAHALDRAADRLCVVSGACLGARQDAATVLSSSSRRDRRSVAAVQSEVALGARAAASSRAKTLGGELGVLQQRPLTGAGCSTTRAFGLLSDGYSTPRITSSAGTRITTFSTCWARSG